MTNVRMMACVDCTKSISILAKVCPLCGHPYAKLETRETEWQAILGLATAFLVYLVWSTGTLRWFLDKFI